MIRRVALGVALGVAMNQATPLTSFASPPPRTCGGGGVGLGFNAAAGKLFEIKYGS
jgi:hypothetical protein